MILAPSVNVCFFFFLGPRAKSAGGLLQGPLRGFGGAAAMLNGALFRNDDRLTRLTDDHDRLIISSTPCLLTPHAPLPSRTKSAGGLLPGPLRNPEGAAEVAQYGALFGLALRDI